MTGAMVFDGEVFLFKKKYHEISCYNLFHWRCNRITFFLKFYSENTPYIYIYIHFYIKKKPSNCFFHNSGLNYAHNFHIQRGQTNKTTNKQTLCHT